MKKIVVLFLFVSVAVFSFSQNSAVEFYKSALINDAQKDYTAALHDLDNALAQNSNYDSAYCLQGFINYKMGEYKLAIKLLDKAIKLNPAYFDALNGRGIVKAQLKDYIGAIKDFSKAIELNPTKPKPFYNRQRSQHSLQINPSKKRDCNKHLYNLHQKK